MLNEDLFEDLDHNIRAGESPSQNGPLPTRCSILHHKLLNSQKPVFKLQTLLHLKHHVFPTLAYTCAPNRLTAMSRVVNHQSVYMYLYSGTQRNNTKCKHNFSTAHQ